jgi:hypothetical protein
MRCKPFCSSQDGRRASGEGYFRRLMLNFCRWAASLRIPYKEKCKSGFFLTLKSAGAKKAAHAKKAASWSVEK